MARDFGGVPEAKVIEGADILIRVCGRLRPSERIAIVCDSTTRVLGDILAERAALVTTEVELVEVAPFDPPVLAAAVRVGDVRLIDNVLLEGEKR